MQFKVKRRHLGDRIYAPGDIREASKGDVQHLIDAGVLAQLKEARNLPPAEGGDEPTMQDQDVPARKAAPKPKNKAIDEAPKNKASD